MVDKWTDGYDPDVGDEKRYNGVPVQPCSVITAQLSGNNNSQDIGTILGAEQNAKLLFATVDIQVAGDKAGSAGDVTVEDSGGTTLFTAASDNGEGIEMINPADGEEVISADETLTAKSADNSNSGLVAEVSVFYATE